MLACLLARSSSCGKVLDVCVCIHPHTYTHEHTQHASGQAGQTWGINGETGQLVDMNVRTCGKGWGCVDVCVSVSMWL